MSDVTPDRGAAFKAERADMLAFCAGLEPAEWRMDSRAEGWRIHDVVAHMGTGCHALFSPAAAKMLRSNDIEAANDLIVTPGGTGPRPTSSPSTADGARWSPSSFR
jgi:Mycothiol maleylpyruvate isomerase N-terminal domain